LICVGNTRK